ncbi:hypothetical protein [Microcoleus sp. F4-D5]|uniref:hypothetical protein n=1 Tax=Microcoleus sp. F4-D5 TaxID=2818760 RepID=UPI002FD5D6CA
MQGCHRIVEKSAGRSQTYQGGPSPTNCPIQTTFVQNPPAMQSENIKCECDRPGPTGKVRSTGGAAHQQSQVPSQLLPERNHTIALLKNLTLMCRSYSHTRTILC